MKGSIKGKQHHTNRLSKHDQSKNNPQSLTLQTEEHLASLLSSLEVELKAT